MCIGHELSGPGPSRLCAPHTPDPGGTEERIVYCDGCRPPEHSKLCMRPLFYKLKRFLGQPGAKNECCILNLHLVTRRMHMLFTIQPMFSSIVKRHRKPLDSS